MQEIIGKSKDNEKELKQKLNELKEKLALEQRTREIQLKLTKGLYEKDKEAYNRLLN